jgi:ribonuclease BN (tRNA processing enzyme)
MRVTVLGTASGLPARERYGQTVVVTVGEDPRHYLLDAGDGASSLLFRSGFEHSRVRGVFISHMHGDHHGGLVQVMKTSMHVMKREELTVLAPGEGIAPLQAYLHASYLFPDWLTYPVHWVSLAEAPGQPLEWGEGVTLTAYANDHLAYARQKLANESGARGRTFESYSAVLEAEGKRMVYSGNLNGPRGTDELAPFVEPCDLLITELAHVDPVELGRFLAGRAIRHTVVTHFHPRWDAVPSEDVRALILEGAGEDGPRGRLTLAVDGEEFEV